MELTTEDQLVTDFVTYLTATPISGLPDDFEFVHFRTTEILPIPAAIIGHEGFEREKMKGMIGTGKVAFRIAVRTDMDVTSADDHREIASLIDQYMLGLSAPGPLDLTYIHAVLRESPQQTIDDRRQITVLRYQVVCTRMEEAP